MKNGQKRTITAHPEGFLPILLAAVSMLITLLVAVINSFVFPFHSQLLSPVICQILILLIPAYLSLTFLSPEQSLAQRARGIGFARLRADYIFFILFTAIFATTGAQLLDMLFGGTREASKGFTVLASFTAGTDEYATSYPYLILAYAIFPAIIEETVFRGVIFSQLKKISTPTAVVISSLLSALFAFRLGGLPSALFCALLYCFVLLTTGSLQACIIVHFIYNLYALLLGTNVAAYFHSARSNFLPIAICIGAWLIGASLFSTESAKIYRLKADRVAAGEESGIQKMSLATLKNELIGTLGFRPTFVCLVCFLVLFAVTFILTTIF